MLIDRFASSLTGIPYKWIGTGRNQYTGAPLMHTEIAQIMDAYEYLRTLPIYFYDGENDIADVLLQVEDWVRRYGIKLMAYDYLQIMMDRSVRGGDSVELVSSISRKLKSAQRRLKIPFLEASQFNREKSQQGRPRMSNLKGSGQIEQDASVIIALDRWDQRLLDEEKDKAKAEGREPDWIEMTHRMDVDFLKYRTGAGDVLTFWEDAKTNRIDDKAPENWVELVKRRDSKPDPVDEEAVYEDLIAGFEKPKQVNLFGDQTNEELPIEPTF
ncbi:MAG: hypothetical protein EOO39_02280 [Cytophagaceae bacterium]|nr:MAG: hypothetical protein EOO39_02280 [Cytophagaceae bacterium]